MQPSAPGAPGTPPWAPPPPYVPAPYAPWPPPRANPERPVVLLIVLVVVVLLVAGGIGYLRWASRPAPWPAAYPPSVSITGFGFEWFTPPTVLCDGWTSDEPWVPFIVSPYGHFLLSREYGCWNDTGSYVIDNITWITNGFSLVASNLPVLLVGTKPSWFNVTLAAPPYAYNGSVELRITAHAV